MYENHEETGSAQQTPPPHHEFREASRAVPVERKSPLAAAVLSALPGLGQVYVGYYQRGFVNIAVAATTIMMLNMRGFRGLEPLLGVFLAFFWIYNMIDATRCAQAVNRGVESGVQPELPQLPAAVGGGSVFAGSLLVGIGLLILGRTVLGFSLEWLAEWWPILLIVFGVRMILTGRRKPG